MQKINLNDYLKNNNILPNHLFDSLKYELDQHIYYYGDQFKYHKENQIKSKKHFISRFKKDLFILFELFKNNDLDKKKEVILSSAYYTINKKLKELNYNVYSPSWRISLDRNVLTSLKIYKTSEEIQRRFRKNIFKELISPEFFKILDDFYEELIKFFNEKNISALFVANDLSFFENISIKACVNLDIASFVFLHGLPGRYNNIDDNRAEYLIVWGEKIKDNYIKVGVNPNKIFVSGHPYYDLFNNMNLRFSLDNILVLTKPMSGAPSDSTESILADRGNAILYLYSIEKILKLYGVKAVRLRPHPSENPCWYLKFINSDFYKFDNSNLQSAIRNSSLIIGPTSTMFLESLFWGVNYLVYEPSKNDIDLFNRELVPPFDGSDVRIPVAKSEEEFDYLLKNKYMVKSGVFTEYVNTPFDLSFVKQLI